MRMKLFLVAGLAVMLGGVAATAGAAPRGIAYSFLGKLTATPSGGHVSISVEGGNRPALRAMLGQPVTQTFAYGDQTEFLQWTDGIPTVVEADDLDTGDYVRVNVRAPRGSSLATIESTNAGLIGDHGTELNRPDNPDHLFPRPDRVHRFVEHHSDRPRRQPTCPPPAARPVADADLHRRQRDDLPALAGQGADCDVALRPEVGRPGRPPCPRRRALDAGPGRGDRRGQGRGARARSRAVVAPRPPVHGGQAYGLSPTFYAAFTSVPPTAAIMLA
jgi:hypothetical protein